MTTRKMAHIIRLLWQLPMRCKYEASNEVMKSRLLIQTPLASQEEAKVTTITLSSQGENFIIGQAVMGSQGESDGNLLTFASPRATSEDQSKFTLLDFYEPHALLRHPSW